MWGSKKKSQAKSNRVNPEANFWLNCAIAFLAILGLMIWFRNAYISNMFIGFLFMFAILSLLSRKLWTLAVLITWVIWLQVRIGPEFGVIPAGPPLQIVDCTISAALICYCLCMLRCITLNEITNPKPIRYRFRKILRFHSIRIPPTPMKPTVLDKDAIQALVIGQATTGIVFATIGLLAFQFVPFEPSLIEYLGVPVDTVGILAATWMIVAVALIGFIFAMIVKRIYMTPLEARTMLNDALWHDLHSELLMLSQRQPTIPQSRSKQQG